MARKSSWIHALFTPLLPFWAAGFAVLIAGPEARGEEIEIRRAVPIRDSSTVAKGVEAPFVPQPAPVKPVPAKPAPAKVTPEPPVVNPAPAEPVAAKAPEVAASQSAPAKPAAVKVAPEPPMVKPAPVEPSSVKAAPQQAVAKPVPAEPVATKVVREPPPVVVASMSKLPLTPPGEDLWKPQEGRVNGPTRPPFVEPGEMPPLFRAVLKDDVAWINELLAAGSDPNQVSLAGDTPLCAAVRNGCEKSVQALLDAGAEVEQVGAERQPPLVLASLRRGPGVIRALLMSGANPNVRIATPVSKEILDRVVIKDLKSALENDRGLTPLIACASRGDVEGASVLIRAGAKPYLYTTRYKRYPINFAATQGYLFLMRIILGRQPESEPEILVTIDLSAQRAWVMKEGKIIDSCSISTGREGYSTPAGRYVITDKHRSWVSTLYHVSMPFFMRLNCGAIGLHSGYVTGRPASHGCIRLPYEKAKKFFDICRVGDEVQIVH